MFLRRRYAPSSWIYCRQSTRIFQSQAAAGMASSASGNPWLAATLVSITRNRFRPRLSRVPSARRLDTPKTLSSRRAEGTRFGQFLCAVHSRSKALKSSRSILRLATYLPCLLSAQFNCSTGGSGSGECIAKVKIVLVFGP